MFPTFIILVVAAGVAVCRGDSAVCQDKLTNCQYYYNACHTKGPLQTWVKLYCPRYCNLCHLLFTTTVAPSTTLGDQHSTYDNLHEKYCFFDGKEYAEGETWQDGCRYNCTCVSGTRGFYTCIPACPEVIKPTVMPSACFYKQYGCCNRLVCRVPDNGTTDLIPYEEMTTSGTAPPSSTTPKPCYNILHNCNSYSYACNEDPHIRRWATQYCARHCNLC